MQQKHKGGRVYDLMDMRKKHELRQAAQAKTPEEKLQEEVNNLRMKS